MKGPLVRFAVEKEVDLIVLASHRIDLSRPGYGWSTLSYKIGVLAPCPVLSWSSEGPMLGELTPEQINAVLFNEVVGRNRPC